jgi:hypothetical protein
MEKELSHDESVKGVADRIHNNRVADGIYDLSVANTNCNSINYVKFLNIFFCLCYFTKMNF